MIKSIIFPMRFHPIRLRKARWVPFCNVYLFTNLLSILLYVVPFYKIKCFYTLLKRSLLLGKRYLNYWLFHYFDYRFQNWNKYSKNLSNILKLKDFQEKFFIHNLKCLTCKIQNYPTYIMASTPGLFQCEDFLQFQVHFIKS